MIKEIIKGIAVLTPEQARYLTNGKVYSEKVYLGTSDVESNWREVDEIVNDEIATDADYVSALKELGVKTDD